MSNFYIARNVRCSFPQLWHDDIRVVNGKEQAFAKGVTILLSKDEHAAEIKHIRSLMNAAIASDPQVKTAVAKYGIAKTMKGTCLRDEGEESWREEYPENHMLLKCNCKKGAKPPYVLSLAGKPVTEEEDPIYSGCRVNVKIEIWLQNNSMWGRRINCKLVAIQFAGDDEPLDSGHVSESSACEGFDAIPGATDSDPSDDDMDFLV